MSRLLKIAASLIALSSLTACTVIPPQVAYTEASVGIVTAGPAPYYGDPAPYYAPLPYYRGPAPYVAPLPYYRGPGRYYAPAPPRGYGPRYGPRYRDGYRHGPRHW
jgi:hypothetical protein